jgi:hypothetical protein
VPRIRTIKPSFFRSEDVAVLPLRARLTWIGLWTHCDDQGRTKDNARLIKGDIWPLDSVSLRDIEEDLETLAAQGRIVRYEVDGRRYLEIVNWSEHQKIDRPSQSKIPPPSDGRIVYEGLFVGSGTSRGSLDEGPASPRAGKGGEGERKGTDETSSRPTARRQGRRIPEPFLITSEMVAWAREHCPDVDGRAQTERFVDYWRGKSGRDATKADWPATWRNWMRRAQDDSGGRFSNALVPAGPRPGQSTTDERVASTLALADELEDAFGDAR